ncbi:MAG: type II secretion system F family protein [Candidatus Omnitrophica bacterium]|nr:type II secretion system F family protein [Candidatus Omnitrophota bacterium]
MKALSLFILFLTVFLLSYYLYPFFRKWLKDYQSSQQVRKTSEHLEQMFIKFPSHIVSHIIFFSPFILGIAGFLLSNNFFIALISAAFGLILPTLIIKRFQRRRSEKFESQLADGLASLSSSLRGGLSFLQAVEVLVQELPPPISQEFKLVLAENKLGVPLEKSLEKLAHKMNSEALTLTVRAVLIVRQSGGDLPAVFFQIVNTIKERNKLEQRIKTLTSQGRMQGMLMGFLPVIFAVIVFSANPSLIQIMLEEPIGQIMLIYALISEIIGIILIKRVCQIEI